MNPVESSSRTHPLRGKWPRIVLLVCVLYCLLFLIAYLSYPLAHAPQLDAKENLELAESISKGSLLKEPFYRSMVYPAILSLWPLGESRPLFGLILGFSCHLLNGFLVAFIAGRVWRKDSAKILAGALYLVNPVLLFFSVQVLDITPATTLFLAAVYFGLSPVRSLRNYLLAGGLVALAALMRPHFLFIAATMPLLFLLLPPRLDRNALAAWGPMLLLFLLHGSINWMHSGEFRMLPWQGSFNLWAANRPASNGLYFQQSVDMSGRGSNLNPAKAESLYLYGEAHPDLTPPIPVGPFNKYWQDKFIAHALSNPTDLLGKFLYKGYAVANSYNQYNNLTYSFHKGNLLPLKLNPLGWGILLVLAVPAWVYLKSIQPSHARFLLGLVIAYSLMLVLFYASARFRLPLIGLLSILAGGVLPLSRETGFLKSNWLSLGLAAFITVFITFSSFANIRDQRTEIQDRLLMANAYADLGEDAAAARAARRVLKEQPDRPEAQRIYALSYFNLRLASDSQFKKFGTWAQQREIVKPATTSDPILATVFAYYQWHWDKKDSALRIWKLVTESEPEAGYLAGITLAALGNQESSPPFPEQEIQNIRRLLEVE